MGRVGRFPSGSLRAACAGVAVAAAAAVVTSCAANPGPPPLVAPEERPASTTTATVTATGEAAEDAPSRSQLQVGIDPVRGGFNPHLASDQSSTVAGLAELLLPSAFHGGVRDTTLLTGVSELVTSPAAFTVRYVIAPEAQWSDGTPVTGADFIYLWRGMTTTPGVVEPAGYRAIKDIRVSGPGGKTVDVDFTQPVAEWRTLFSHLLPSHLLAPDASDFPYALRNDVPAAAGRYLMEEVDRVRGTITLNRNDRFWGPDPAAIDILTLSTVRDTTQAADQLRSRQLAYADLVPQETTEAVFGLIEGVQTRTFPSPLTLGVVLSATSGLDREMRSEVRSLIDVPLLARIAAGRSTALDIPAAAADQGSSAPDVAALRAHTAAGPLRVAADPADTSAAAAARSLVDLLAARGIPAKLVSSELTTIAGRGLPGGDVDLAVVHRVDSNTLSAAAGRLACPPQPQVRAGNLAGFCSPANDTLAARILAGELTLEQANQAADAVLETEALWVPLLKETRIAAYSGGISAGGAPAATWPGGLAGAASWKVSPVK